MKQTFQFGLVLFTLLYGAFQIKCATSLETDTTAAGETDPGNPATTTDNDNGPVSSTTPPSDPSSSPEDGNTASPGSTKSSSPGGDTGSSITTSVDPGNSTTTEDDESGATCIPIYATFAYLVAVFAILVNQN